jgi:hypothetical protein
MAPSFSDVYDETFLLLTTFTKDGKPKPTTAWGVPDGDKLKFGRTLPLRFAWEVPPQRGSCLAA